MEEISHFGFSRNSFHKNSVISFFLLKIIDLVQSHKGEPVFVEKYQNIVRLFLTWRYR